MSGKKPKIKTETITTVIPHVDRKLQAAYERLAMLHTETMAELAATKKQLATTKKLQFCQSWWCRLKRKFV